jgi:hypothetical protein
MNRALLLCVFAAGTHAATPCPVPRNVPDGASLEALASRYLGSSRYSIAIALATNARTQDGFHYIANPDDLTGIAQVCVPSKSEARQLLRSWNAYEHAVNAARLPRMSGIGKTLVTIAPDQPVKVVAWERKDQADHLKTDSGEWVRTASSETWVTVEPYLQEFCRAFVRDHRPDETILTRRLEQRLGLAPASSKAYFVRMRLDHPGAGVIFRPCVDPRRTTQSAPWDLPRKLRPPIGSGFISNTIRRTESRSLANFLGLRWDTLSIGRRVRRTHRPFSVPVRANS